MNEAKLPVLSSTALESGLPERLLLLARQYAIVAQEPLGDNLTSLVLFGSVARGQVHGDSDIDLLLVCRSLPQGAFRRQEMLQPIRERLEADLYDLWRQGYHVDFSELLMNETEAQQPHLLYLDMTEDAILLFDGEGFFAEVLDRIRKRLRELGSHRRQLGGIHYWDLKPDFQPGEEIIL